VAHQSASLVAAFLAALAFAIGMPKLAWAEGPQLSPASFNPPPPGTTLVWQGTSAGEAVIKQNEGLLARWTWQGKAIERYGLVTRGDVGKHFAASDVDAFWPLVNGKSVTYLRKDGSKVWQDSLTVVGTETVVVPAGTFDAYLIQYESTARHGEWSGKLRVWYAPSLGWAVKNEYSDSTGEASYQELIAVRLP